MKINYDVSTNEYYIDNYFKSRNLRTKIMTLVENVAARTRMCKVCLTVLVNNVAAMQFYRKLGYTNNEKLGAKYSYRILSKSIKSNPEAPLKYCDL